MEIKKSPQVINDVIDFIKDRLDSLTIKHKLYINLPENIPQVEIDEVRIGEVLTNLVENAVKFSDESTNIIIEVKTNDKELFVSVSDEGVGIPAEFHEKIFERFFQGEGQKNGRRKGTGLGLAICRGIVEAHGGKIRVESDSGRGSRFIFSLPLY